MKSLLCMLFLSAMAFGQAPDVQTRTQRESKECHSENMASSFPGVLLAPSDDQAITGAHALVLSDPGASFGIGTTAPTGSLSIIYPDSSNRADAIDVHSSFGIGATFYTHADPGFRAPQVTFFRSRGTQTSPSTVIAGIPILTIVGGGYDGNQSHDIPGYAQPALMAVNAEEDFSPSANGAYWTFQCTQPGAITLQTCLDIHALQITAFQPLVWSSDNQKDIGTVSGSRPRTGYFGTSVVAPVYQTTLRTPTTSVAGCTAGQMWADSEFIYVCTAPDTIKRAPLNSF
jgi:hypothetical protein